MEPKKENDLEAIKQSYEGKTEFTAFALEELCKELDGSRGWQNLADLLDLGHFAETKLFETEPTKNLLKLALVSDTRKTNDDEIFIFCCF